MSDPQHIHDFTARNVRGFTWPRNHGGTDQTSFSSGCCACGLSEPMAAYLEKIVQSAKEDCPVCQGSGWTVCDRAECPGAQTKHYRQLWQNGIEVASVIAPTAEQADREIAHYALVYGQDGPVEIRSPAKVPR